MVAKVATENVARKICFVIMPISDVEGYPPGHFSEVYRDLILPSVEDAGYICQLATSTSSAHMIQLEVVTKVATADLCICDLSTNNPNVMFEYGIRQAFDKPTVLIKDTNTKRIFDLSGFRDIEYDPSLRHSMLIETRSKIKEAINHTVAGKDDQGQIFSLVQLMRLTKAAIPTGDISQTDAQMQLLNSRLDQIVSRFEAKERVGVQADLVSDALRRYTPQISPANILVAKALMSPGLTVEDLTVTVPNSVTVATTKFD